MKALIGLAILGVIGWQLYERFGSPTGTAPDLPSLSASDIDSAMRQLERANIDLSSLPEISPATAQCYQRLAQDIAKCDNANCLEREAKAVARCAG